jgi:2,3-dihydroxy-p-cumate/2,3-dihydroxybenzoate 3,4-dioxygenase
MIELQGVTYVRLGTRDIEGATRFATDVLGLEIAEVCKGALYFKSDQREHTLCYVEGDSHDQAVAFEVGSHAELSAAASELERLGHSIHAGTPGEAEARKVREFISFFDRPATGLSWYGDPPTAARAITARAMPASPASVTLACAPRTPCAMRYSGQGFAMRA